MTVDLDGTLLCLPLSENDYGRILAALQSPVKVKEATKFEELLDSWMYVARLDIQGQPPLFYARYISATWKAKKIKLVIGSLAWSGNALAVLDESKVLPIDRKVDFFSFGGSFFIVDKDAFERALNFRKGMEQNRDEIVREFETLGIFDKASEVSRLIGDNLRHLRKLSQVKKAGYYCQNEYMKRLREVNDQEGWGLKYTPDGKIMVTEQNIKDVLTYLNNDRLTSKITEESFDVDVKRKIG